MSEPIEGLNYSFQRLVPLGMCSCSKCKSIDGSLYYFIRTKLGHYKALCFACMRTRMDELEKARAGK